jgi:replication factor A1
VLFHYALVDDLITKEEFERRVEEKIEECGDLVDEPTAAMLVVGELGREHVKIKGLSAKSSLFSFFGKILDKTEPKEFDRADGEKGWVATLLLGDETGTTRVVLWDEKAGAALDVVSGDVLEVIGRHPGKSTKEIYALALRKATCEINCSLPADGTGKESLSTDPVDLEAHLIAIEEPRTYNRRDGTTGEMVEAIIGDTTGTARVVAWAPELFEGIIPGTSVRICSAKPNLRSEGRAYSLDEKSAITPIDREIAIPFTPLGSVGEQGTYSVQGIVKETRDPRSFTSRTGAASWVKNVIITDGTDELRVVLWGDNALLPLKPGDPVEVYHAAAKPGRYGGIELGVGRGSAFRIPSEESCPITFTGTLISGPGCMFIDDGRDRYLIDSTFPQGSEVRVSGTLSGSRIIPEQEEAVEIRTGDLMARISAFRDQLHD